MSQCIQVLELFCFVWHFCRNSFLPLFFFLFPSKDSLIILLLFLFPVYQRLAAQPASVDCRKIKYCSCLHLERTSSVIFSIQSLKIFLNISVQFNPDALYCKLKPTIIQKKKPEKKPTIFQNYLILSTESEETTTVFWVKGMLTQVKLAGLYFHAMPVSTTWCFL